MEVTVEDASPELPSLYRLLSIWPIAERIAQFSTAAGLIGLARTNSDLRYVLHGGLARTHPRVLSLGAPLRPEIGEHQTPYWVSLKRVTPLECASVTHTRGQKVKGCVYCSMPICEACIVRDSFKHPNENTFRNRLRYLCKDCWFEGRPIKNFRFNPVAPSNTKSPMADEKDDEHTDSGNYDDDVDVDVDVDTEPIPEFCGCSLKENGWLCLDCKHAQNSSELASTQLTKSRQVQCYGVVCSKSVDLSAPDKDTRRICRWCENPVRRQLSSDGMYRLQRDFAYMSALRATSRRLDMAEYHRQRQREMKMSRFDMRGTGSKDLELLRHLDCVNYRNYITDASCPSPDVVWKSKMGIWIYERDFLLAIGRQMGHSSGDVGWDLNWGPSSVLSFQICEYLQTITKEEALPFARTNEEFHADMQPKTHSLQRQLGGNVWSDLVLLKPRILDLYAKSITRPPNTFKQLRKDVQNLYDISISLKNFGLVIKAWLLPADIKRRIAVLKGLGWGKTQDQENDYLEYVKAFSSQLAEHRKTWRYQSLYGVIANDLHDLALVESAEPEESGLEEEENNTSGVVVEENDDVEGDEQYNSY